MKKRGQISIFIIVIVVIAAIAGLGFYYTNLNADQKTEEAKTSSQISANEVFNYAQSCVKQLSEDALFNLIGIQGGYISVTGQFYNDPGAPPESLPPSIFQGFEVPYYVIMPDSTFTFIPELNEIESKISNYLEFEYSNCLKKGKFEDKGIKVVSAESINANTSINEEDVTVTVNYLILDMEEAEKIESFSVKIPIRLKALHESAEVFVNNAREASGEYDASLHCSQYNKNSKTNLYIKNPQQGEGSVIQLVDFSTYENNYFNSFIFQFAVKGLDVVGSCV